MSTTDFNLWTILIQYAAVQGLILAVLIYIRYRSIYLGVFFASISYLLFIYLFERFEWFRDFPHLIWTNVPLWFLIGPLLYLYVRSYGSTDRNQSPLKTALHFLPALAMILYISGFYFGLSGQEKIAVFTGFYSGDQIVDYVQMIYLAQIAAYMMAGHRLVKSRITMLGDEISNSDFIHLRMVRNLFLGIGFYIILAAVLSAVLIFSYPGTLSYFEFVFAALASTIFIATGYYIYYSTPPHDLGLQAIPSTKGSANTSMAKEIETSEKYASSSLGKQDRLVMLKQIQTHMVEHQSYKQPDLKIADLAEQMGIPAHHLSQCLNQELGQNFFEFVNGYRVKAVKQQLQAGRHRQLTLLAIAKECGFNSQSSFYRIFKETTGMTPSQFIDEIATD